MSNFVIESGVKNSNKAEVDGNNRLQTKATTETRQSEAANNGDSYNLNTGTIALTTDSQSALAYIKNNGDKPLHVEAIGCLIGNSTGGSGDLFMDVIADMQRHLHTLKGGARLSELEILGNLTHELETLLEAITDGRHPVSEQLIQLCYEAIDCIGDLVEDIESNRYQTTPSTFIAKLHSEILGESVSAPILTTADKEPEVSQAEADSDTETGAESTVETDATETEAEAVADNVVQLEQVAKISGDMVEVPTKLPETGYTATVVSLRQKERIRQRKT